MTSLFKRIVNIFKKREIKHIEIDPESIRTHNQVSALSNENAELKGKLAKYISKEGSMRKREQDKEEEKEVRIELNEQKKELEKKSYPKYFSLMAFCRKLIYNKSFKENLFFSSFNGSERLSKFGDLGLSSDGNFVLLDDNRQVIMSGKNLNDIFWSVGALESDLKAFRIPLCLDSDGGYIENPIVWESPTLIPTKDGKFRYSKARKKPFYEYIKELMGEIQDKNSQIEELELTLSKLYSQLNDLKVGQRVAEDYAETSKKELSEAEITTSSIGRIFRSTEKELTQIRDLKGILEENVEKLEKQVEIMRNEAEREGIKLSDDRALEIIQRIRRELVRDEPSKSVQIIEKISENKQK